MTMLSAIDPVQQGWPGSRIAFNQAAGIPIDGIGANNAVAILLVALLLFFLLFFRRAILAIGGSFSMTSGLYRTQEVIDDKYFTDSVLIVLALLTPIFAYSLIDSGITSLPFIYVLITVVAYLLLHYIVIAIITWMTNRKEMKQVAKCFSSFMVLLMTLSALAMPVSAVFTALSGTVTTIWTAIVCAVFTTIYIYRTRQIIIGSGFSRFFWFLYLCGLEILPICVVVKVLVS